MATRKSRRTEWHQLGGMWTRTFGDRGTRVRLFQRRRDGVFWRDVWLPGGTRSRKSLGTADRHEAERLGKALLSALLKDETPITTGPITLAQLWERYQTEASLFIDNKPLTKLNAECRVAVLLGFFGADRDVRSLTALDQEAYSVKRRGGGIPYRSGKRAKVVRTNAVRQRSVDADLSLLHSMLKWAMTVRLPGNRRWLEYNPLEGVRRVREKNPKRPVATWERFHRTCVAMRKLRRAETTDEGKRRWLKIELALILAEATGRRLNSIRNLRWEDVDFERGSIRWRAEADKKGQEWVVPITHDVVNALRVFQRRLRTISGWVFQAEVRTDAPMDRYLFDKWLRVAEDAAGLPKLDGGLWHPYRRKWATERKHHSLKDVAAAGGWKDVETLLTCYQQADAETMLAVVSEPKRLREVV